MQTCLIVDEAPVIRKIASRILLKLDLDVETAATPEDARTWIRTNGLPDILMVSAANSDGEGLELVREVAAASPSAKTVILASIVESNLGLMTRLKRAGASDFVMKPFDRETLSRSFLPYLTPQMAAAV